MSDWKCPNCGHVIGQITILPNNAAAAAPTMTYSVENFTGAASVVAPRPIIDNTAAAKP